MTSRCLAYFLPVQQIFQLPLLILCLTKSGILGLDIQAQLHIGVI